MSTHAPYEHGAETEMLQSEPARHRAVTDPTPAQIKRWRRYLADEESEARIYRYLAKRAEGTDREILLQVAEAEKRHQQHWRDMLGEHADVHVRPSMQSQLLQFLAKNFGSVFIQPRRWRPTKPSTRRSFAPWQPAAARSSRATSVRRSLAPTTAWSQTWP